VSFNGKSEEKDERVRGRRTSERRTFKRKRKERGEGGRGYVVGKEFGRGERREKGKE
jgi:hypothetical protein